MEPKVQLDNNGQGVTQPDFNVIARSAAMNAEYIWWQLLRTAPTGAGSGFTPVKGIIPSEGQIPIAAYSENYRKSLIGGSQSNDASLAIQPFVAVLGSRSDRSVSPTGPHDETTDGPRDGLREIRLAPHYGTGALFQTLLQIPASVSNNRWDVIYAKVDVDTPDAVEPRYIKVGDGPVTAVSVSVVDRTKVTVLRASGIEASNPVKPSIPSDGGGSYYILLGYYFVAAGHTLTTSIQSSRIHEAFSPMLISPGNGGARSRPANRAYSDSGYAWAVEQWSNSRGKVPVTHLSPNMVGIEEVIVAINAEDASGYASHPPGITVIDDSIDWRKRYFTTVIEAAPSSGNEGFPHADITNVATLFHSTYSPSTFLKAGQSFQTNLLQAETGDANAVGSIVVYLDNTSSPSVGIGAKLVIFVQASTGRLCCWRNNVEAGRRVLAIITARGRYANTDAGGV